MKLLPIWLFCCIAPATLVGSPAWAAPPSGGGTTCSFQNAGLSLNFGNLDPSSLSAAPATMVAIGSANMAGDCGPTNQIMQIDITGGVYSRQLTGPGGNVIAYSISGFPITLNRPGNNGWRLWFTSGQITGTIAWPDYADKPEGTYTETVGITITP
jgi:hypothetical protein